jgi:hypothetical protein
VVAHDALDPGLLPEPGGIGRADERHGELLVHVDDLAAGVADRLVEGGGRRVEGDDVLLGDDAAVGPEGDDTTREARRNSSSDT